ncbi:putative receptor-like protein kinase [Hordeum vulgare]|nr:putative receptor-like protein kinase [Hordeum vulgare]
MHDTPGYAAPEMRMQAGASDKCDVYSFGILLFEILGRRRNFDEAAPESRQWFPKLAWTKYESGELMEAMESCDGAASKTRRRRARRMCEVAFWCVQQQPEARPPMGVLVKMLDGEMDIAPPANPFQHLMAMPAAANRWTTTTSSANTALNPANGGRKRRGLRQQRQGGKCKKTATPADGWAPSDARGQDDVEHGEVRALRKYGD